MAITVTDNSLSTNARYVVYSGSTAANDAQTLLLGINDALVNLGWTKYDNAGASAVLGSADDAKIIMRKTTYDNSNSGHYTYLSLRMRHNSGAYIFYIMYSADHTGNSTYGQWVNPVYSRSNVFSDGNGIEVNPNFTSGGTIWLFQEDNSLVMKFTGTGFTEGERRSCFYFGEYDKIFGEACDTSTGYIHNGVAIDGNEFVEGTGVVNSAQGGNISSYYSNASAPYYYQTFDTHQSEEGTDCAQFALTEYPQTSAQVDQQYDYLRIGRTGYDAPIGMTSSNDGSYSDYTRVHLGWLGWIGHIAPSYKTCLASVIGTNTSSSNPRQSHFTSGVNRYTMPVTRQIQQYLPNPSSNQIALYEPVISSGTINSAKASSSSHSLYSTLNNNLTAKRVFAMHGKLFGFRMSLGQPPVAGGGYAFLDTANIPLDVDGYYNASGTTTACWAIPIWTNSYASACLWVKK